MDDGTQIKKMIKPMMGQKGDDGKSMGQDMGEMGSTILDVTKFPQLQGAEQGAKVSGTWEGLVDSIENDQAKISFSSLEISTENQADKEVKRMSSQGEQENKNISGKMGMTEENEY